MNKRRQILLRAATDRFRELSRQRLAVLRPEDFGEQSSFISRVQQQFVNGSIETLAKPKPLSNVWEECEPAGLPALRRLSLAEPLVVRASQSGSAEEFLRDLKAAKNDSDRSLRLLLQRYACPTNFALPAEDSVREFVLERLMVVDRRALEAGSNVDSNNEYLWYRLNLVAIHAQASADLRFLDALNYYYELTSAYWQAAAEDNWLVISYLALYARALAALGQEV